ncbi:FISUMP domain-containing protein [Aquirufa nivalisilvae]
MNFKYLKYSIFSIIPLIIGCQKLEWNNPFDTNSEKSLFTPTNLTAQQVNNTIKLTWTETNSNISGYTIYKQIDNGSLITLATLSKGITNFLDNSLNLGKSHKYRVVATAGSNISNATETTITPSGLPIVSSVNVISKTYSTISISISNFDDQGAAIQKKGLCWSYSNVLPTIQNNITNDGSGNSSFNTKLTSILNNQPVYIRAYATNSWGTSYGPTINLTLSLNSANSVVKDVENNSYPTVKIGDQIWMAKNLTTSKYNNGTPIPNITDQNQWISTKNGAYSDFANNPNNVPNYGHLYNYFSIVDSRGVCPTGFHIPSKSEFETLISYLEGPTKAAQMLKESGTTYWDKPFGNNLSGFSARSGSWRGGDGIFYYAPRIGGAYFWTSTKEDPKYPWVFNINSETSVGITKDAYFEFPAGTSIRCLKN